MPSKKSTNKPKSKPAARVKKSLKGEKKVESTRLMWTWMKP